MKAIKNFYWKDKYYNIGDEAPEGVPKSLVGAQKDVPKVKKHKTVSTKTYGRKNGAPDTENKSAAPKAKTKKK